jgi:hypothetical protein
MHMRVAKLIPQVFQLLSVESYVPSLEMNS